MIFSDQEYTVEGDLTIICPSGPASTLPGLFQSFLPHLQACLGILAIYEPMIYTAPYVMVLMRADPVRGQVGVDMPELTLTS
jgi:hypothetical protein